MRGRIYSLADVCQSELEHDLPDLLKGRGCTKFTAFSLEKIRVDLRPDFLRSGMNLI
jgi:hypothetical protein